jgi:hypothetical protein
MRFASHKMRAGSMPSAVANRGDCSDYATMKIPVFSLVTVALSTLPLLAQDGPVDWKTLATEFSQDAAAAQAKYQGQMLTVTGPVSSIAQGDMTTDNPSVAVTLSTPDGPGPDVKCLFQNEDLAVNSELYVPDDGSEAVLRKRDSAGNVISSEPIMQTGQQIVVTGSFLSFDAGDIVLQHCKLSGSAAR